MMIELPMTNMELYLRNAGMQQVELSELTGIPQPKISVMCMHGKRKVSEAALIRIKRVLHFPGEPMQLLERVKVKDMIHAINSPKRKLQSVTLL